MIVAAIEHVPLARDSKGEPHHLERYVLHGEDGSEISVNREGDEYGGCIKLPGQLLWSWWIDNERCDHHHRWTDPLLGWHHAPECTFIRCLGDCTSQCGPVEQPLSNSHRAILDHLREYGNAHGWEEWWAR